MKMAMLAAGLAALAATAAVAAEDEEAAGLRQEMDVRWERLQAETEAMRAARREAQERYEREVREAAASRTQYEADLARHREEVESAERAQAEYETRMAIWRNEHAVAGTAGRRQRRDPAEPVGQQLAAAQPATSCEQQSQRNRRRGRRIGGLIGGIAGGLGSRIGGVDGIVTMLSVGRFLGEAIADVLDCDEQQKAAAATEEVIQQAERVGVGTSVDWESETRPGVRGSSTVTGVETASADGECMTVTDIVIIDGEETRAPKRMCRRPPSTRYVRI